MNRNDFFLLLKKNDVPDEIVSFDEYKDGYCIREIRHHRWEVFVRERGVEYNVRGFPSESDALVALSEELIAKKYF